MGSESSDSLVRQDNYALLREYRREAKILESAYAKSRLFYRRLWELFTYPVVILSACLSVLTGLEIHKYVTMALSLILLLLAGFDRVINPKDLEHKAHTFVVEFKEIQLNIKQFILANDRTPQEIKAYCSTVCELMKKWNALKPFIWEKYVKEATLEHAKKVRAHNVTI